MLPSTPTSQTKVLKADSLLNDFFSHQQQQRSHQQQHQFYPSNINNLDANNNNKHSKHKPTTKARIYDLQTGRKTSLNYNDESMMNSSRIDEQEHDATTFYQLPNSIISIQRKLLAFFYIYAILIVSLYLTYAIYCYYQHSSTSKTTTTTPAAAAAATLINLEQQQQQQQPAAAAVSSSSRTINEQEWEQKLHLLEKYIEVIALDLEETKMRLREREKCACSMGCSANGTQYNDGQQWKGQKCDICSCKRGQISCQPQKCPSLPANCDNVIQLPGQCCPSCMKNCKFNKSIVKHGHSVKSHSQQKQCKCNNGLIKCESIQASSSSTSGQQKEQQQPQLSLAQQRAQNRTRQYLQSIMQPPQLLLSKQQQHQFKNQQVAL